MTLTPQKILSLICSAEEAGDILGVTKERVGQVREEPGSLLVGRKLGRDWVYVRETVEAQKKAPRKPIGRPKKISEIPRNNPDKGLPMTK